MIESSSAVHDTGGIAGIVVHVAEPEPDQPEVFPACTYSVREVPADRLSLVCDRPVGSDHAESSESSELVWYFVAPLTAGQVQVIESSSAVHDTDGIAGIVVQAAESDDDQPAALPACTSSVSEMPADRSSLIFDRPVGSDHRP
ncbi:hypothetical protein [Candidatus Poriferisocius sp.]|uniref:hypothetical protein n=1 Tax=Candidatus Poriferisocius sp. TaxID=3101276 RepID=UPI003B013E56